jgi:hypothetical protein
VCVCVCIYVYICVGVFLCVCIYIYVSVPGWNTSLCQKAICRGVWLKVLQKKI